MALSPRMPDLRALDLLLSVARTGSLGAAAREHGISQQAASSRIRTIEGLLGIAIVQRGPRGSRLTDDGTLVVGWAERLLELAAEVDSGIATLRGQHDAHLHVSASLTVAEHLMPGWLIALRRAGDSELTVHLTSTNSTHVAEQVLDGRADLGFIEGPTVPRGLASRTVAHDHLVLIVSPDHPWARRSAVEPADVAATPLVAREPGSGTREAFERALLQAPGVDRIAAPVLELGATTAIREAVLAGAGPAVLSSLAVAPDLQGHRLREVAIRGITLRRALRAVHRRDTRMTGPAQDLLRVAARPMG
ncbi:MAG TPA: LysR family transcriptional regulator [Mycobacteriales bacterium]|nr:LysR family transcriptional regulator [Mycobacteriales bacterium]